MAQLYCPGPALFYVGPRTTSTNGGAVFLGTSEDVPTIDLIPHWKPVLNQLTGAQEGFDIQSESEGALITCTLNRYNESVLTVIQARPRHSQLSGNAFPLPSARGVQSLYDVGTLLRTERADYTLYVAFPYSLKPAYGAAAGPNGAMPRGYRFHSAFLVGPDRMPVGVEARRIILTFQAGPLLTDLSSSFPLLRLYDHDMSGLPAIN